MNARLSGNAMAILCLLSPFFGALMAVYFQNNLWLVFVAPAIVYMEGGLFLIGLALAIVATFGKGF